LLLGRICIHFFCRCAETPLPHATFRCFGSSRSQSSSWAALRNSSSSSCWIAAMSPLRLLNVLGVFDPLGVGRDVGCALTTRCKMLSSKWLCLHSQSVCQSFPHKVAQKYRSLLFYLHCHCSCFILFFIQGGRFFRRSTRAWPTRLSRVFKPQQRLAILEIVCLQHGLCRLCAVLCMSHLGIQACMGSVVRRDLVSGGHTAQLVRNKGNSPGEKLGCCQ
jgi:hypothetical protein